MAQIIIDLNGLSSNLGTNDSVEVLACLSDLFDHLTKKEGLEATTTWEQVERSAAVQVSGGLPQIIQARATIGVRAEVGRVRQALASFPGASEMSLQQLANVK